MGFANQFDHERGIGFEEYGKSLEKSMEEEYPGTCRVCGREVCKCPPIPAATLGRIAKEAPIDVVFPGRHTLFSVEESMKLFGRVEAALQVGNQLIQLNKAEFDQMAEDVRKILRAMREQLELQPAILLNVAAMLGKVETLASQGAVTQATVQSILEQLVSLPSEQRDTILGFFNNLAASATFQAILVTAQTALGGMPGI